MSEKMCVQVPEIPAIGPYSQAVKAGGLVFVSGQPGIHPETGEANPDFPAQAMQSMRNLETVLRAAGCGLADVVNTTVLVADMAHFAEINRLFAATWPADPPARMTMQVPLPRGLQVSIGCVAVAKE